MAWLLTLIPILLVGIVHFPNQGRAELCLRPSNYWIVFYLAGYFLPIPLFMQGEDLWTQAWGYPFSSLDQTLIKSACLATVGALLISIFSSPKGTWHFFPKVGGHFLNPIYLPRSGKYLISIGRIVVLVAACIALIYIGVRLIGGLGFLLSNLADRINLFAGLNAFFLPANMLIGINFSVAAVRALGGRFPAWAEYVLLVVTLCALFLLGQKANLFILILGVAIIKMIPKGGVHLGWLLLAAIVLVNLLMMYEFIFREALVIGVNTDRLTAAGWWEYLLPQVTGNLMQIQNLSVLVDAVPKAEPYAFGSTYIAFFTLIIPQAFVAVKPLTAAGLYTLTFWPDLVARDSTTMPPGLFGEAYMNFGVPGFVLAHVAIGRLLRWIEKPYFQGRGLTAMNIVATATAGAMSLHFIRGEFFSPFLILVGIIVGSRFVVFNSGVVRGVRWVRAKLI